MQHITKDSLTEAVLLKSSVLVARIVEMAAIGGVAYFNTSINFIALRTVEGTEVKATAALKKAGVADHTVKNAKRHVAVYDALVVPGHVPMGYFEDVTYMDAVEINRAIAKLAAVEGTMPNPAVKRLVAEGLFKKSAGVMRDEFSLIGDTGQLKGDRVKAIAAKAAADKVVADKVAADKIAADKIAADKAAADEALFEQAAAIVAAAKPTAPATVTPAVTPAVIATPATVAPTAVPTIATTPAAVPEVKAATVKPPVNLMAAFDGAAGVFEAEVMAVLAKVSEIDAEKVHARVASILAAVEAAREAKAPAVKVKKSA
jgi:hypothetical protein